MPAKKDAPKASATPTPAPAETPGAPALTPSVDAASSPVETPPVPPETEPEEHEEALAKLGDVDDDAPPVEPPAPAAPPPSAPANTSSPGSPEPVESEADALRREMALMQERHAREMREAMERVESLSHKPPAAPVPVRDPLREAKLHGVLATWKGPGTYGGPYYTINGVRMPYATGITTGYFPAADLERHADLFTKVK